MSTDSLVKKWRKKTRGDWLTHVHANRPFKQEKHIQPLPFKTEKPFYGTLCVPLWNRDWNRHTLFHYAENRDWKLILISRGHYFPKKVGLDSANFLQSWTGHIQIAVLVLCRFQSRFQSRFSVQWNTRLSACIRCCWTSAKCTTFIRGIALSFSTLLSIKRC